MWLWSSSQSLWPCFCGGCMNVVVTIASPWTYSQGGTVNLAFIPELSDYFRGKGQPTHAHSDSMVIYQFLSNSTGKDANGLCPHSSFQTRFAASCSGHGSAGSDLMEAAHGRYRHEAASSSGSACVGPSGLNWVSLWDVPIGPLFDFLKSQYTTLDYFQ